MKLRKPKLGASLDQYNRYVQDKYVRRKFVADKTAIDPLTAYRNGSLPAPSSNTTKTDIVSLKSQSAKEIVSVPMNKPKSVTMSLLD